MARRKRHRAAYTISAPGNGPGYIDRTGQRVGALLVTGDSLNRTAGGKVLWDIRNVETGQEGRITTCNLARKARARGVPIPDPVYPT